MLYLMKSKTCSRIVCMTSELDTVRGDLGYWSLTMRKKLEASLRYSGHCLFPLLAIDDSLQS